MLINGFRKIDDLNEKLCALWYEPEYQWYFSGRNHYPMQIKDEDGDERSRTFASVGRNDELIGCMGYNVDHAINGVWGVFAIRFPDGDRLTFGRDLQQFIDDIFVKFNFRRAGFGCVVGNPAERMYDRHIVGRMGGRVLCVQRDAAVDMRGNLCDFKQYEVMREDYLREWEVGQES